MGNGVTYKPEDEHTQLLIAQNLKLCQTSMSVAIDNCANTGKRAHERMDAGEDRLIALDHKEVGKVTIMWEERKEVVSAVRKYFIGMLFVAMFAVIASYWGGHSGRVSQAELNRMINESITELVEDAQNDNSH